MAKRQTLPAYYGGQPADATYIGHAHNNVLQVLAAKAFSRRCFIWVFLLFSGA